VFIDSGGYQIIRQKISIDPKTVFDFQNINADIGLILDIPPVDENLNVVKDLSLFMKYTQKTKHNIDMIINRERDFKLYTVLQGETKDQLELWWKECVEPYLDLLDGVAVSVKPPSNLMYGLVRHLAFLKETGYNGNIHLLGMSGWKMLAILTLIAHYWRGIVSFDSSTYIFHAKTEPRYHLFNGYVINISMKHGLGKNTPENLKEMPCDCPVCKFIEEKMGGWSLVVRGGGSSASRMLPVAIHNLYVQLRLLKTFKVLVNYPSEFYRVLESFFNPTKIFMNRLKKLENILIGRDLITKDKMWF
jgi:tRNA-guanine family transglycosylase